MLRFLMMVRRYAASSTMAVEAVILAKPTRLDKARHFSKSVSRQSPDATATLAETTSRDPGSRLLFCLHGNRRVDIQWQNRDSRLQQWTGAEAAEGARWFNWDHSPRRIRAGRGAALVVAVVRTGAAAFCQASLS